MNKKFKTYLKLLIGSYLFLNGFIVLLVTGFLLLSTNHTPPDTFYKFMFTHQFAFSIISVIMWSFAKLHDMITTYLLLLLNLKPTFLLVTQLRALQAIPFLLVGIVLIFSSIRSLVIKKHS